MPTSDHTFIIPPAAYYGASAIVAAAEGPGATFAPAGPCGPARGRQGRASAPLGRSAELVSNPGDGDRLRAAVRRRYALQTIARDVLPGHRVESCMRAMVGELVDVRHHRGTGGASFSGLATCGSAWICPVCSTKILAGRADELKRGAAIWEGQGNHLLMLTLTLRHKRGIPLETYLNALNEAYRELLGGGNWVRFREQYQIEGYVTRREITTGNKGWHPHLHALIFMRGEASYTHVQMMEQWIKRRWVDILHRLGFDASEKRGADLRQAGKGAADYVSKLSSQWSVAHEISSSDSKAALHGNLSFAQLLLRAGEGRGLAQRQVREYAAATKGKTALKWSPGLRLAVFGTPEEKSDGELAAESGQDADQLISLTRAQWRDVLARELRGELLAAAVGGDVGRLAVWCARKGLALAEWQIAHDHWHRKPPGMP